MDCKHRLEDLMGVEGGIVCTRCGKHFDHIPKQDAPKKAEPEPTKVAAPVKKTTRKAPAKKGDK